MTKMAEMIIYEIYDPYSHVNDTNADVVALEAYEEAIDSGKSEDEAEVLASNVLHRAGFNVNATGGISVRKVNRV